MIIVKTEDGNKIDGIMRSPTGSLVNRNKEDLIKYNKEKNLQETLNQMMNRIETLELKLEILGR